MDDIHSLSEEDIKLRYITPAILAKGIKPSLLISASSPKKRKRYCAQMNS